MAQFDANINLKLNAKQVERDLKKLEQKIKSLDRIANPEKKLTRAQAKVALDATRKEAIEVTRKLKALQAAEAAE